MSWGFFFLLISAFFNPLWVTMAFILIYHLLKLMTLLNFWISNLIADIFKLTLLWYQLLRIQGRPHDQIDWGGAAKTNHMIYYGNEKKRRKRYFKVDRKPIYNKTWFHQSNRSCVHSREKGRNFIKTLREHNKNYLHLTLRRLQAPDGR